MRGSERLLYLGNFNCLCAGINENESLWQMKRVAVTDAQIYFFPNTNYTIKTPKLIEDWSNYNDFPLTIPQLQERSQYLKQNELDPDSITAPPLQVQQVSDKQVQLISIDQLVALLQKAGHNIGIQNLQGQAICLINKLSKEVQYLIAQNQADNIKFYRSIIVGNAFQKYQIFKNVNNIQINQNIIAWLQDSVNISISSLEINSEQLIPSFKLLCECTHLVNGLIFKLSLNEHFKTLISLIQSLKPDQLIRLTLKNCDLQSNMIADLNQVLQNCPYIEQLDFSQNSIDDRGIDLISKLFEHCLDITAINLSQNRISGKDLYFEVFLLKAGTILNKVTLDFSQNQLTDSSITAIEQRLLIEELCSIKHINLSYNNYSKDGVLKLFNLFKEKTNKGLTFKIFPLPFTQQIIEFFLKNNERPANDIIYEDSQELQVSMPRRGPSLLKQSSILYHHQTISQHIFKPSQQVQQVSLPTKYQITFLRKSSKKLPPSNGKMLKEVQKKEESIQKLLEANNGEPSVEDIYQITEEIKIFPYRLSHKIVNKLIEIIWQKLNDAIIYRDNYSISFLTFSSFNMEMDITIFKEKYVKLMRRLQLIEDRINRLLNFQIEETKINKELDDIIAVCHRLDIRGTPLDYLIRLKQEREAAIKHFVYNDYQWQQDYYDDLQNDSTQFIYRDKEFANQKLIISLPVDQNLVQHPLNINYYELSRGSIQAYEQYYEILYKILKYQAVDFGKIQTQRQLKKIEINQQAQCNQQFVNYIDSSCNLTNFDQAQHEKVLYLAQLGVKRTKFFIHNHFENFNQNLWRESSEEFQLNNARLIINYYSSKYRKEQLRDKLEKISSNYQEMKLEEIIGDIDAKGIKSESRYLMSDIKIKHHPIKFTNDHNYSNNNIISIFEYPFFGSSQQLDIDDPIYLHAQTLLMKQIKLMIIQYHLKNSDEFDNNQLLQSIRVIIDICMNSPCPSLFGDELYLNLLKIQQKEKELDFSQIFFLLLHFVSPSRTLSTPLYNWLTNQYQQNNFGYLFQAWDEGLPMIYWLPCISEINSRLNENSISINILFMLNQKLKIDSCCTVIQIMDQIYKKLDYEDKGQFWIYMRVEVKQDPEHSELIYLDIPLLSQLGYWEHISRLNQTYNKTTTILVKRRIFSMNCLEYQTLPDIIDQFVNFPFLCYHYSSKSINLIIILLMCIESINDQEESLSDLNIYNYIQFIPKHLREQLDIEELVDSNQNLIGQLVYYDQKSLISLSKLIFSCNPGLNSSIFVIRLANQQQQMIVNYHGIFFYNKSIFLHSVLFPEIIGISISSHQMRMHTYRQQLNKYIITFLNDQSLECYQDILSYMALRLNEKIESIGNYLEFAKYRYKYNISLLSSFDQNEIVNQFLDRATKNGIKNIEENYQKDFIKQFLEDNYMNKIAKKIYFLNNIVKGTQFHRSTTKIFPFQQNCPIIEFIKPKLPQSVDITNYFSRSSRQEIRRLFDPIRELFPSIDYTDDSPQSSKGKSMKGSQKVESLQQTSNMVRSLTLRSKAISTESRRVSGLNSRRTLELYQLKSDEKQEVKSEQQTNRKISNGDMYRSQEINSEQNSKQEFIYKIVEEEENVKSEYSPSVLQQHQKRLSSSQTKTIEQNQFQSIVSEMTRYKMEEGVKSQKSATLIQYKKDSSESSLLINPQNESIFSSLSSNKSRQYKKQTQSEQFIN